MKKAHFILASYAALLLGACAQTPADKFARAQESYAEHDYASARLDLISALQDEPGSGPMLALLAKSQLAMGDGEGVAATLAKMGAAALEPEYAVILAEAEVMRGRYEAALAALEGHDGANVWRARALAQLGLGNTDEADAAFRNGFDSTGNKAPLRASYARYELAKGNYAKARASVDLALKEQPDLLDAMLLSGLVATKTHRLPAALKAYEAALAAYPDNQSASLGKIGILGDLGRLDEAEELMGAVALESSNDIQVVYLRARLASERENWARARSILQEHEMAMRENPSMQALYGQALLRIGQVEQARGWLAPLVRKYPSQRLARRLLGEAQLAGRDPSAAFATLRPVADRPDATPEELTLTAKAARASGEASASLYFERAKLPEPEWLGGELAKADNAMRNGNWPDAAARYQTIVDRSAKPNAMILNNLAFTKSKMGQKQEALALALRALEISPDHPSIMDTAGWLLHETGKDRVRGQKLLAAAAKLAPDNPAIARHLAAASSR